VWAGMTVIATDPSGPVCDKWADGCDAAWYCLLSSRLSSNCTTSDIRGAVFYAPWVTWTAIGVAVLFMGLLLNEMFSGFEVSTGDRRDISSAGDEYRLCFASATVLGVHQTRVTQTWDNVYVNSAGGWSRNSGSRTHVATVATLRGPRGDQYPLPIPNMQLYQGEELGYVYALKREGDSVAARGPIVWFYGVTNGWTLPLEGRLTRLVRFSRVPLGVLSIGEVVVLRWFAVLSVPAVALVYVILGAPFTATRLEHLKRHIGANVLPRRVRA
jgi:hypothetical protein